MSRTISAMLKDLKPGLPGIVPIAYLYVGLLDAITTEGVVHYASNQPSAMYNDVCRLQQALLLHDMPVAAAKYITTPPDGGWQFGYYTTLHIVNAVWLYRPSVLHHEAEDERREKLDAQLTATKELLSKVSTTAVEVAKLKHLLRQVYYHPANVTGERFSEHLMDANMALSKQVAEAIGDIKPSEEAQGDGV